MALIRFRIGKEELTQPTNLQKWVYHSRGPSMQFKNFAIGAINSRTKPPIQKKSYHFVFCAFFSTGKSLSKALLFAEHGENMLCTKSVLNVRNNFCTQHVLPRFELGIFMYWTCNSMNNLSSYCGLVDAKIRVSDKG